MTGISKISLDDGNVVKRCITLPKDCTNLDASIAKMLGYIEEITYINEHFLIACVRRGVYFIYTADINLSTFKLINMQSLEFSSVYGSKVSNFTRCIAFTDTMVVNVELTNWRLVPPDDFKKYNSIGRECQKVVLYTIGRVIELSNTIPMTECKAFVVGKSLCLVLFSEVMYVVDVGAGAVVARHEGLYDSVSGIIGADMCRRNLKLYSLYDEVIILYA